VKGLSPNCLARRLVDEDVRVGAAGGLLGAAVGVGSRPCTALRTSIGALSEMASVAATVWRAGSRRPRHRGCRRFRRGDDQRADDRLARRRRLHLQREAAVELGPRLSTRTCTSVRPMAAAGLDGHAQDALLLVLEREPAARRSWISRPSRLLTAMLISWFAAGEVLHVDRQHGAVADREEARRRQFDHQRGSDGDLGLLHAEAFAGWPPPPSGAGCR
jgi:hypothetical protein